MADYVRVAVAKEVQPLQTPKNTMPKYKEFLATENPSGKTRLTHYE